MAAACKRGEQMGGGSGRKADGRGCWLWRSRCQEGLQTRRSPSPPPPPRGVAIGIAIELPPPGRCAPLTRGEERTAGGRAASRSFRLHCCCCLCRRRRNHHRHSHRHRHNHRYRPALPAGRAISVPPATPFSARDIDLVPGARRWRALRQATLGKGTRPPAAMGAAIPRPNGHDRVMTGGQSRVRRHRLKFNASTASTG